jgi:hypothetical protein
MGSLGVNWEHRKRGSNMTLHELLEEYAGGHRWFARGTNYRDALCTSTKREAVEHVQGMYPDWTPNDDGDEERNGAGIEPLADQITSLAAGGSPFYLASKAYLAEDDCGTLTVQDCIVLGRLLKRLASA